jgi:hypothetical protein
MRPPEKKEAAAQEAPAAATNQGNHDSTNSSSIATAAKSLPADLPTWERPGWMALEPLPPGKIEWRDWWLVSTRYELRGRHVIDIETGLYIVEHHRVMVRRGPFLWPLRDFLGGAGWDIRLEPGKGSVAELTMEARDA